MRSPISSLLAEPRLERMLAFNSERDAILDETVRRVVDGKTPQKVRDLELVLNDVFYEEDRRFRTGGKLSDEDKQLRGRFRKLQKRLRKMSDDDLVGALSDLTRWYANDVVGNFNPAVFAIATRILPVGLNLLFAPFSLGRSLTDFSQLRERILVEGQVADLGRLAKSGTLVVVPTHLSNMDSIVIGFALERSQLPPCTYGAGKNLFDNPLLAFFMRNLGAYRVDRRIRHDLYKHVLKSYSTVLLERGYHSLFFPGGTQSRSGMIEAKLKLGLAGTALEATVNGMAQGRGRPIYFVPATLNYHLVLEASTLIDDYLKEAGKNRYIIDDDESTRFSRVARYLSDVLKSDASMTIQFGDPMDVLGHRVSPDGVAHDDRGRPVNLKPFLTVGGVVKSDPARDAEYTRELGEKIAAAFKRDTHVLSTHLVAYVLFRLLMKKSPGGDLFHVLRGAGLADPLPLADVLAGIGRVQAELKAQSVRHQVRLGLRVERATPDALLDEALHFFSLFHTGDPAAERLGDGVAVSDRPLLYYYHNRLVSYGLEGLLS